MFGIFFYNSLFLQNILGYGAIETGAAFLPMTVLIMVVAPIAGKAADHLGPRWLMGAGMALLAASLLSFATLDVQSSTSGTSCPACSSPVSGWRSRWRRPRPPR